MTRREQRRMKSKAHNAIPEISLTPLIDTVLVLLVIFMVSMPLQQNAIKVNLPQGDVQEVQGAHEDIVVSLDKEKRIFVNKEQVTDDTLLKTLKAKITNPQKQIVFINADGDLTYEYVTAVIVRKLKKGGISRVALSTKPEQRAARAA